MKLTILDELTDKLKVFGISEEKILKERDENIAQAFNNVFSYANNPELSDKAKD